MMRPVHLRWLAPILVLLLIAGCSSDNGTGTIIRQGDPNDAAFLTIKAEVDAALDSLVDRSFDPLTNPWGFPLDSLTLRQDYGPFHPDDTVDYGYDNGWYNLYLGSFATALNLVIVDSVMFFEGSAFSSWYNIHTTGIHVKSHITSNYVGDEVDYTEQSYYCDASYVDVNLGSVIVDAEFVWRIADYSATESTQIVDEFDIAVTVNNLKFNRDPVTGWDENIPVDGTVDLTVTYTSEVTEGGETATASRDWTFNVTFSADGTAFIEVISENTRWTYSDSFGS